MVLLLVTIIAGLWWADKIHLFSLLGGPWLQWWKVLLFYFLILILWSGIKLRRRVVIEEFVDYTVPEKPDIPDQSGENKTNGANKPQSIAKGLATLLVVKLAQVREMYQAGSTLEQRPIQTDVGQVQSVEASTIDDVRGFLKDAVSAESRFTLGFLQIPVGTIIALFARVFQGPRIIGALHGDSNTFILTAQRVGSKQPYHWRVENAQPEERELSRLDEMITELAYRMFADIELIRSIKWKALRAFTDGLRVYRECLYTSRERILKLRQAERKLLEAVDEDERFALAYYNLGVVYIELGQFKTDLLAAAETSFLKAIEQNALSWRAYYALMLLRLGQQQYTYVIQLCDRIIAFKPGAANRARVYHWKGYAQRLMSDQLSFSFLAQSIITRKQSVTRSWIALCIAELKGQDVGRIKSSSILDLKKLASDCLVDLAVARTYQAYLYYTEAEKYASVNQSLIKVNTRWAVARYFGTWAASRTQRQYLSKSSRVFRKSQTPFRQALSLTPANADIHFEFGKMYDAWKKYDRAVYEFECATQLHPKEGVYWAYLAAAYAALAKDKEAIIYACKQAMEGAWSVENELFFEKLAEAYKSIGQDEQSLRISGMNNFLMRLEDDVKGGKSGFLEDKLEKYKQEGQEWEYAQVIHALGKVYLELGRPLDAEKCFRQAIKRLEKDYAQEIKLQGLRAWLARALIELEEYDEALQEVEQAEALDPLSSFVRNVLAEVYDKLNELEQAINAWQVSLLRKPYEPDVYFNIGAAYIGLGQQCRDAKRRKEAFQQSIIHFRQALDLYKSNQQIKKGAIRYYLGSLHIERSEYEDAISNFEVAYALHYSPLSSRFYLGYANLQNKEYDEAINIFRGLLLEIGRKKKNQFVEEEVKQTALLALTNWGLASALVERGSKFDLNEAEEYIKNSESYYKTLKQDKALKQDEAAEVYSLANYYDTQGWMYYKQGKITEAILYLEHALSLSSKAKTYIRLALAYEYRLHELTDITQLHSVIAQVRLCCQQVEELDVKKEFEQAVKDLLQRLSVYEQLSQDFLQAKLSGKEITRTSSPNLDENAEPRDDKHE
jgi:tetratricopeptide (TPR) repeat protein